MALLADDIPLMSEIFCHAYIVGVGGIGTSGLAMLLRDLNFPVCGSDLRESVLTHQLQSRGVEVFFSPQPERVKSASCLIIPSFLPPDHPELIEAKSAHLPVLNRTQALSAFAHCFVEKLTLCCGSLKRTQMAMMLAQSLGSDAGWCVGAAIRNSNLPHARFSSQMVIDLDERDFYYNPSLYSSFPNADVMICGWFNPDFGYYPNGFTQEHFIETLKKSSCNVIQGPDLYDLCEEQKNSPIQFVGWFEPFPKMPSHRHEIRMHPASVYESLQNMQKLAENHPVHIAIRPFISTLHSYSAEIWAQALRLAHDVVVIVPPYEGCSTAECLDFAQQLSSHGLLARCLSLQEARNKALPDEFWLWNGAPDLVEC